MSSDRSRSWCISGITRLLVIATVLLTPVLLQVALGQVSAPRPPGNSSPGGTRDLPTQLDDLQRAVTSLQQQMTTLQSTLAGMNQRLQSMATYEANINTLISNQGAGINQAIAQSQSQIQAQLLDTQRRVAGLCLILVDLHAPQHVAVCGQ